MKHLITLLAFMLYTSGAYSQFTVSLGAMAANADNKNPISFSEVAKWDGFQSGVPFGDWMTESQLNELSERAEGIFYAAALSGGYDLPLLRSNDHHLGLSGALNLFIQTSSKQNLYQGTTLSPSVGAYVDFGLRLDVGVQKYAHASSWYFDISGMISQNLYLYTRYQRGNPFVSEIKGVFYDGSPITLETASAGLRYIFHDKNRYAKKKESHKKRKQAMESKKLQQ